MKESKQELVLNNYLETVENKKLLDTIVPRRKMGTFIRLQVDKGLKELKKK